MPGKPPEGRRRGPRRSNGRRWKGSRPGGRRPRKPWPSSSGRCGSASCGPDREVHAHAGGAAGRVAGDAVARLEAARRSRRGRGLPGAQSSRTGRTVSSRRRSRRAKRGSTRSLTISSTSSPRMGDDARLPRVVLGGQARLYRAGALLSRMEVGVATQRIQKEIAAAIEEILKASISPGAPPRLPTPAAGKPRRAAPAPCCRFPPSSSWCGRSRAASTNARSRSTPRARRSRLRGPSKSRSRRSGATRRRRKACRSGSFARRSESGEPGRRGVAVALLWLSRAVEEPFRAPRAGALVAARLLARTKLPTEPGSLRRLHLGSRRRTSTPPRRSLRRRARAQEP